ncbi:MAG: hypothetical protein AAFX94_03560, partial [Myxococcota bacterium]
MKAAVIRTGTANLASVRAGLVRAGVDVELTVDPALVRTSTVAVLPGVGAHRQRRSPGRNPLGQGLRQAVLAKGLDRRAVGA